MSKSRPVVGQPNLALKQRMAQAGFSESRLASHVGVHVRTVQRWLKSEVAPQAKPARDTATALNCEPHDIWPDIPAATNTPGAGTVALLTYASRSEIPVAVWNQHFSSAREQIDVCVYGGTFLFDSVTNFEGLLANAASEGAKIRFLVGDPKSPAIRRRGEEERISDGLAGRCRVTLARLRTIATDVPMEVRVHDSALYVSMFRSDKMLIANHHIHGLPASDNPAFVLDQDTHSVLWSKYETSFNRIWSNARLHP